MSVVKSSIVPLRYANPTVVGYVKSPSDWFVSNSGWIRGRDGYLLIDTCATERATLDLLDDVRKYSPQEPGPPTVVITHAHGEHHNGVGVALRDGGVALVGASAVATVLAGPQCYEQAFTCSHWGRLEPPSPGSVHAVADQHTVDLGDAVAEVYPVPGTAHTAGDLVVYEPVSGVLFTGDLLFVGATPVTMHGSATGWLAALDWLTSTFPAARAYVPGHGPVTPAGPAATEPLREYLRWLLDSTTPPGTPDFPALTRFASRRWPEWISPERHIGNLMRAHAEQHGASLPEDAVIKAILTAAGGRIDLDHRLGLS